MSMTDSLLVIMIIMIFILVVIMVITLSVIVHIAHRNDPLESHSTGSDFLRSCLDGLGLNGSDLNGSDLNGLYLNGSDLNYLNESELNWYGRYVIRQGAITRSMTSSVPIREYLDHVDRVQTEQVM